MSVLGLLTQIPPQIFSKADKVPSVLDIFFQVFPVEHDEPKLESLDKLLPERIELLQEILSIPRRAIGNWTFEDLDILARYKVRHLEDYRHVLSDLPAIIDAGKHRRCLEINKEWHIINFLFSGDKSDKVTSALSMDEEEFHKINPILCGTEVVGHLHWYYVNSAEVKSIAHALSTFPQDLIQFRFQQIVNKKTSIYPGIFRGEDCYEWLLELCKDIQKFYYDAASQGNLILIRIG